MILGLISDITSYPTPNFSNVPFLKFSKTTSEFFTIVLNISIPSLSFKFNAIPFLFLFIIIKAADSPLISGGKKFLVSSPPGVFSTLITSAPRSANNSPQVGPAIICAISSTRMPFNDAVIYYLFLNFGFVLFKKD